MMSGRSLPFKMVAVIWLVLAGQFSPAAMHAEEQRAQSESTPAIIQMGWGMPTPDVLWMHGPALDQVPFDGVAIRLHVGFPIFKHDAYADEEFKTDRADLAGFHSDTLKQNFIVAWATMSPGWDWASDGDWKAAEKNIRNFARTARVGNCRGIFLDAEAYGASPWDFSKFTLPNWTSFDAYAAIVYARGREFIKIVEEEFPGAIVFMPWGPVSVMDRTHAPERGPLREEFLRRSPYGLFPSFVRGMLDGSVGVRFVDGDEASYYYLTDDDFNSATRRLKAAVQPDISERYQIGHAVYLDWILDPDNKTNTFGHYVDREQRLAVLELAVHSALGHADSYVWIYSERVNWWKEPFPAAEAAAILRAKTGNAAVSGETKEMSALIESARRRLSREGRR